MSDWICPECGGGFPAEFPKNSFDRVFPRVCPWCEEPISLLHSGGNDDQE